MANKKLNQFTNVPLPSGAEFIVGYRLNGLSLEEVRFTVSSLTGQIGESSVTSVFGRNGAVTATSGDYNDAKITNSSNVAGDNVKEALNQLDTDLTTVSGLIGGGGGGTGALIKTDDHALVRYTLGTPTGDTRGVEAVDLQYGRSNANQVAKGVRSNVLGGKDNRAFGNYSTVVGGFSNHVNSNTSDFIGGGQYHEINGTGHFNVILFGNNNSISGANHSMVAAGWNNTISGDASYYDTILNGYSNNIVTNTGINSNTIVHGVDNSIAPTLGYNVILNGRYNTIDKGYNTIVQGEQATPSWYKEIVFNAGINGGSRHYRCSKMLLTASTLGASNANMAIPIYDKDGNLFVSHNLGLVNNGECVTIQGQVLAHHYTLAECASWKIEILVQRSAGTVSVIASSVTNIGKSSGFSALSDPTISVSGNNIIINVKYIASNSIAYTADLDLVFSG